MENHVVLNQENSPTTESPEVRAGCPLARGGRGGWPAMHPAERPGGRGGGATTEEVFYFFKNKLFILK